MTDDPLRGLRDALELTPDNVPLRLHLAQSYLSAARPREAVEVLRDGIRRQPGEPRFQRAIAEAYHQNGRHSEALVVLEELMRTRGVDGPLHMLMSRVLLAAGEKDRARHHFREAVDVDPDIADESLAEELGVAAWTEEGAEPMGRQVGEDPVRELGLDVEKPDISFEDVGGMAELKDEIRMKIIHPMEHPEIYAAYGKSVGGGLLMYGPPGCGKTHLARATAGQVDSKFLAIGISDVLDMYIGESERKLSRIFKYARSHKPCVLFFDEVDALGGRRSSMRHSGSRNMVNQFLSELDGMTGGTDGVLVLAATNAPWDVDPAFRRPGRFDRVLFVPPPDREGRADILRTLLEGKPVDRIDHDAVARKTDQYSGADLKGLVDRAVEDKLRAAMNDGVPTPLTTKDLVKAAKAAKPTTKEWFASAKNYALYSNQGGAYDDVLRYLGL